MVKAAKSCIPLITARKLAIWYPVVKVSYYDVE